MSASNRFETDVFLSFAEADDDALMEGEPGWVTRFRATLEAFAKQILGRPLILADQDDAGLGAIGSATFVTILSPSYLRDQSDLADLTAFSDIAAAAAESAGGDRQRLFKAVKRPVDLDATPEPLKPCLEYTFFELDEATGAPREFRPEFDRASERRFNAKTYELAQDLCTAVQALQENGAAVARGTSIATPASGMEEAPLEAPVAEPLARTDQTPAGSVPAAPAPPEPEAPEAGVGAADSGEPEAVTTPGRVNGGPGRTIYLADTTSDQAAARDLVRSELLQLGHTVLPDRDLPLSADPLKSTVGEALARCDLAVHIVGGTYGLVPEGESRSLVELQCELSGTRGLPRLLWLPPDVQPADERQASFIETLERQAVTRRSTDLLRTSLDALKTAIRDALAELDEAVSDPAAGDRMKIYVMCDQDDYRATKQLADFLSDTGFQVWRPTFAGEPPDRIKLHKKRLRECDANIVFYGRASDTWFELKLEDWEKAAGLRAGQMLIQAVFIGAPLTPHKRELRVTDAVLIDGAEQFSAQTLEPLLREIRQGKAVE